MLNGLDLFSGIGGIAKALEPWVRPIAYCEKDRYAQAVLLSRMRTGDIAYAPIWDMVETLSKHDLPPVDIVSGGFPCQDISCAGAGVGLEGSRSGLFFELLRLVSEIRPRFVFLENVPAITLRGLDRVLLELTALGFDSRWTIVSAKEMGAPHFRQRWFLLAYAARIGRREGRPKSKSAQVSESSGDCGQMADSNGKHGYDERYGAVEVQRGLRSSAALQGRRWWESEPDVGRVANGISARVDRLRGLGNAVVPAQAREAFERLMGWKR